MCLLFLGHSFTNTSEVSEHFTNTNQCHKLALLLQNTGAGKKFQVWKPLNKEKELVLTYASWRKLKALNNKNFLQIWFFQQWIHCISYYKNKQTNKTTQFILKVLICLIFLCQIENLQDSVLIDIQVKGVVIALQKTQFKQEKLLYRQNYTDISFYIFPEDLELFLVHADVKEVWEMGPVTPGVSRKNKKRKHSKSFLLRSMTQL